MRFTLSWLKKFLETDASLDEIANRLTMIGLEVEEISDRSKELAAFEIAEILSAEKHPDADKLQVCQVKTSDGTNQIVYGAPNARAGIKVVLAKEGTIIPSGNFKIKKAKIRGVDSNGMLCSADELGIGGDADGIIELSEDAKVGGSFVNYMGFDDPVIHINITPNRADALGVYGVARDLAAAGIGKLKDLTIAQNKESFTTTETVKIHDKKACPFFAIREIKGVNNAKTPKWLHDLLDNAGIGSISPLVDVTNYISYSFGQPMHAYDADKIGKNMEIYLLKSSKKFNALNDKEYELPATSMVISDENETHCLAGIIGGSVSACDENTSRIMLEAASFNSDNIAAIGRKLQIDTDSRYRFERNVNSEFTLSAMEIATALILEICGGEASNIVTDGDAKLPDRFVEFAAEFLESRAGFFLSEKEICSILEKLGFHCEVKSETIKIKIPSWRYDVAIKEDIVEEIVRIYGYDNIPETPLPDVQISRTIPKGKRRISDIKRILATKGYQEVVSWSFTDSNLAKHFGELRDDLYLQNPISSDLNYMRNTILPNLLKMARLNINRNFYNMSIFEIGPVYEDPASEDVITHATGIRFGDNIEKNSFEKQRPFDIYDIKSDLQSMLATAGIDISKCQMQEDAPSYYHPTRSASLYRGKNKLATFGQLNPAMLRDLDIDNNICAFEVYLTNLPESKDKFGMRPAFNVSNYQKVTRDFAFLVDDNTKVGEITRTIEAVDRKLIKNVILFDVYAGKNIDSGKKSVAISTEIQDDQKTLTDEEINNLSDKIIGIVKEKYNAVLRDG